MGGLHDGVQRSMREEEASWMAGKTKTKVSKAGCQESLGRHIRKYWQLYVMMLIPIAYYVIFRYIPMVGNIIAFRRYRAGSSILRNISGGNSCL